MASVSGDLAADDRDDFEVGALTQQLPHREVGFESAIWPTLLLTLGYYKLRLIVTSVAKAAIAACAGRRGSPPRETMRLWTCSFRDCGIP